MKFISTDKRTGTPVGSVIEMEMEELNALPFNVFMKRIEDEPEKKIKKKSRKKKIESGD